MEQNKFLNLTKDCKSRLLTISKENIYEGLFQLLSQRINYDLDTYEKSKRLKTPKETWNSQKGHCFELSYLLLACLNFLKNEYNLRINIFYLEQPELIIDGKWWDHSSVMIETKKEKIILDIGRKIYKAKYKKFNKLSGSRVLGNYYIDSALMLELKNKTISRNYLSKGLQLYPSSKRGKNLKSRLS